MTERISVERHMLEAQIAVATKIATRAVIQQRQAMGRSQFEYRRSRIFSQRKFSRLPSVKSIFDITHTKMANWKESFQLVPISSQEAGIVPVGT